ncbi:MAG: hypothetical protein ACLQGP_28200 [Isosphaeraceae bacterium]
MSRNTRARRRDLGFEPLEGRALMSVAGVKPPHESAVALVRHHEPKISFSGAGKAAIINALLGGAGHEITALALKEVKNPLGVAAGFSDGSITQYSVPGIVVKQINLQSGYTGAPHDVLALNVGGAVALKGKKIELGAIVRGPFTTTPFASTVVFAINRGAGSRLGPYFAGRPGITPDALVAVTVGPYGQGNSATITDLTTGTTQTISSPVIQVAGPTVRILLDTSQLPTEGFSLNHYTFAVWTETQPNAPFDQVGSFVPEDSMIPIGVETNVRATL